MKHLFLKAVLVFSISLSIPSLATVSLVSLEGLNTDSLRQSLLKEHQFLKGNWQGVEYWAGSFCDGNYHYKVKAQGFIDDIKMDLRGDNQLVVRAVLSNGYAKVDGDYLSDYSLCSRVMAWLAMGTDRIHIQSTVYLLENSPKVRVKVNSLRLGTVHVGTWVPAWFEDLLTRVFNRTLVWVWQSNLGAWLDAKLSDYLNSKLPGSRV